MPRYEFQEGNSSKFWEIELQGSSFTVTFGRIGTAGQTQTKAFGSAAEAQTTYDKLVKEKVGKGYQAVGGTAPTAVAVATPPPAKAKPAVTESAAIQDVAPSAPAATAPSSVAFRWDKAVMDMVLPRRGMDVKPSLPTDLQDLLDKTLKPLRDHGDAVRNGRDKAEPEHRAAMDRLIAKAGESADEIIARPLDLEDEAATLAACGEAGGLVQYWLARGGTAFAVDALLRSMALDGQLGGNNLGSRHWFLARKTPMAHKRFGGWVILRNALAAADEGSYQAAEAVARRSWPAASLEVRCALAYAFPERPEWSEEAFDAILAGKTGWSLPYETWWLLASLRDPVRVERLMGEPEVYQAGSYLATILYNLREAAIPILARHLSSKHITAEARRDVAKVLGVVESEEVARIFAGLLEDKSLRKLAQAWLTEHAEMAARILPDVIRTQKAVAQAAAALLAQVLRSRPDLEAVAPGAAVKKTAPSVPEAAPADLPGVLTSPPWLNRARRQEPRVVRGLQALEIPEAVVWDKAPTSWKREPFYYDAPPTTTEKEAYWKNQFDTGESTNIFFLDRVIDATALKYWNEKPASYWYLGWSGSLVPLLVRFDLRALPGTIAFFARDPVVAAEVLSIVSSPSVAPLMADAWARLKTVRQTAQEWLRSFPEAAAAGLIPPAVGPAGKARESAEAALRWVASKGHAATVRAVAARYGPDAAAAVEQVLAADPLQQFPDKMPKMPAFWDPKLLTRPLLKGRQQALPLPAVEALGTMLAFSRPDAPYAGLDLVKAACDATSLEDFAWDLFQEWLAAGADSKEQWAFFALAHLGGDAAVRRLVPLVRAWPGEAAHARATIGLEVLATIGTDMALMGIFGISQKIKFKGLQDKAKEKIQHIADARGLTMDELADRLVPDFDLDPDGSKVLDFGSQSFRVGFDEKLKPFVRTADGKRLPDLPKGSKADDGARVEEAVKAWKGLKKDVATVAALQIVRLELAMCSRRRWEAETFTTFLAGHPLVTHLARRLVWAVFDPQEIVLATFRVAEDGTLADGRDAAYVLPPQARVGIPHRLDLDDAAAASWSRVFADYEIVQPFPQLGRAIYRPSSEERDGTVLQRVRSLEVPFGKVLGLERRGWRPMDLGESATDHLFKPLPGGTHQAELSFDPGLIKAAVNESGPQTLGEVNLRPAGSWAQIHPIAFSEIVLDLMELKP